MRPVVVDLLRESRAAPGAVAMVSRERMWSFAGLDAAVDARAEALRVGGVEPGAVVPVTAGPDAETVIELLALWRVGATPAPLNAKLTDVERGEATRTLSDAPAGAQAVLWTSGTSGRPRGVAIPFGALAASARGAAERLDLSAEDVWLSSLSPAHVGGLALVTRSLLLGGTLVAVGATDAAQMLTLLEGGGLPADGACRVTHFSVVPTQLLRLLDEAGGQAPPRTFRCALVGGARAPSDLVARALDAGWPIALSYGLTQATSQVATASPELVRSKPGSLGAPLRGVELRIASDGEILVRGETLAGSYVGAGDEPLADAEGWHHTGDLGRLDDDGDLWVTGRRADRIVSGGVTVDAVEVEEALRAHASVADACVVGLPDAEWGERLAAWVVPSGATIDLDDVDTFLRGLLSGPKLPRGYHVGTELPRNPNGKVDRRAVVDALAGGRPTG